LSQGAMLHQFVLKVYKIII